MISGGLFQPELFGDSVILFNSNRGKCQQAVFAIEETNWKSEWAWEKRWKGGIYQKLVCATEKLVLFPLGYIFSMLA